MIAELLAALVLSSSPEAVSTQTTAPQAAPAQGPDEPVDLGDVTIEGRRLQDMTEDFVREVGQPSRGRGLARWKDGVCVGVANLQPEVAQYIVDRVSTVAQDLGLKAGEPGCNPSVLIVATTNANAFTEEFVSRRPRLFVVGASGTDLGRSALQRFIHTDRPVRAWTVTLPTDSDTGVAAVKLPGQDPPIIAIRGASRLTTQIVDVTKRSFVIVDVDRISGANLTQLADYLAMVTLAQIDPDADTSGYATVLNLFSTPDQVEGLTQWDMAYLTGLYDAQRTLQNQNSARVEIASSIVRAHHRLNAAEDARAEPGR
ncbi:MAG: hypothetical protein EBR82_39085 [Caulobacteraceae bacterium]|nr:hypothetical protein [Caulobacteraceae bacterium]